jgi:hypothetical protein
LPCWPKMPPDNIPDSLAKSLFSQEDQHWIACDFESMHGHWPGRVNPWPVEC